MAHRITKMGKINFVVEDLDASIDFWQTLFQARPLRRRGNTTIGKRADGSSAFAGANIELGGFVVDLAMPSSAAGPLGELFARQGEGFLSVCLEVEDFWDSFDWFAAHGLTVVGAVEMMGNRVGFIPREQCHGILVEIIQRPAWWTWEDSKLTPEGLQEIVRLVREGHGSPRPLERPADRDGGTGPEDAA